MRGLHFALLMLLTTPAAVGSDRPVAVEIITDSAHPVVTQALRERGIPFAYYVLDAPAAVEREFGHDLPAEAEAAKRIVLERLRTGGEALTARLKAAFQGAVRASAYGIERVPAIVLDHRAVVYGVNDAGEALARFQAWQGGRDR